LFIHTFSSNEFYVVTVLWINQGKRIELNGEIITKNNERLANYKVPEMKMVRTAEINDLISNLLRWFKLKNKHFKQN